NNIPIDFIGGTSMGGVIAAMYATGISPAQMDSIARTEEFQQMVSGEFDSGLKYYFKQPAEDASFATLRYSQGKIISNALPSNLIDPTLLDWNFMAGFSQADAASELQFDQLMIPMRCIAADIENKQQIIFRDGPLNEAVRASCTYPFYMPPRRINDRLLYDGGIFNNYPIDVLYQEFMPDVIIGCNVSGKADPPSEDDMISQLQAMILYRRAVNLPCEHVLTVEPKGDAIGTFEFSAVEQAIALGYTATFDSIASIQKIIERRVSADELNARRRAFRNKFPPFIVEAVEIDGLAKAQNKYVRKVFGKDEKPREIGTFKEPYFRVFEDDKVQSVYPSALFNPSSRMFKLHLDVKKEKDLMLSFGGNFSSRSINTGFIGMKYHLFGLTSATWSANSYFGRFYGSVNTHMRWDLSGRLPVSVQAGMTFNRWDYYKSLATFFEDVKPSFVLMNERFGYASLAFPAGNAGALQADFMYTHQFDEYYQISNFISTDTADRTNFDAGVFRLSYERNTLNRKQFANTGTFLRVAAKFVSGTEYTIPGSTSILRDTITNPHLWQVLKLQYQNYFIHGNRIHAGLQLEGVASTQDFFQNYIASSIAAPAFAPIPESKTFFLPQFRAHNYAAAGAVASISLRKNVEFRNEIHIFHPFGQIVRNELNQAAYDRSLKSAFIGSSSIIVHTLIGPLSLSANYYELKEKPWSVLVNFGYILFNKSPRD
ncbi:MAG: patatin-like phospholipase family protein, partial [Flavobacteriales bacterium]